MKRYKHRERGSITVFLSILLIPTIFLTGLLTDLARIKLYSNQALMTADNYGEAVLTQYDNVLKELYGLFSVTQNEEGLEAVATLQDYMKTSFDPTINATQFKHLKGTIINKGKSYDGNYMPYKEADVKLEWEKASDSANLSNVDVLSTQIGDFMRYRVVKEGADWLLEALDSAKHVEADTEVMEKKTELDDQVGKALNAEKAFYEQLKKMNSYYDSFLKMGLNKNYQNAKNEIDKLTSSDRYKEYIQAAKEASEAEKNPSQKAEKENEEEAEGESDTIDLSAEGLYFSNQFDQIVKPYKNTFDGLKSSQYPVDFDNYVAEAGNLLEAAMNFEREVNKIQTASQQVRDLVDENAENDVSEDLKTSVRDDLDAHYGNVIDSDKADTYIRIANSFMKSENLKNNDDLQAEASKIYYSLEQEESYYLRYYNHEQDTFPSNFRVNRAAELSINAKCKSFQDSYMDTYKELKKSYEDGSTDSEAESEAKSRQSEAEGKVDDAEKAFETDEEESSARNIPAGIEIGKDGKASIFHFDGIIKSAASLLNLNWKEAGNELLLKTYTVVYDFGMFTDRITEKKEEEQESLTGYSLCEDINYLYGAELEYLYGGFKNSSENLKETRNQIVMFRAAVNLASTFTVTEVNEAINAITEACMAANPLLGIAVAAALRLGVAAIETYADWSQLKDGKSVTLIKMRLDELSAYDDIVAMLPEVDEKKESSAKQATTKRSIELNYEQYLTLLLIIFTPRDTITQRTGDLICLNVNNVEQGSDFSSLAFRMDQAITAVKASCSVHLNYTIMPDGYVKKVASAEDYASIKEYEKHYYKYSIIRGY